jgi:low affinity Fe/Cu permease
MQELFRKAAHKTSEAVGTSWAFMLAVLVIVVWAVSGPIFDFSDTWQLVINTGTTILTFLMVFLIQNTQNRDAHAIHLKLDELIKATRAARNVLIDAEDMSDEEIERLKKEFDQFRTRKEVHHPLSHKDSHQ